MRMQVLTDKDLKLNRRKVNRVRTWSQVKSMLVFHTLDRVFLSCLLQMQSHEKRIYVNNIYA